MEKCAAKGMVWKSLMDDIGVPFSPATSLFSSLQCAVVNTEYAADEINVFKNDIVCSFQITNPLIEAIVTLEKGDGSDRSGV